jgi:hypothetical protein
MQACAVAIGVKTFSSFHPFSILLKWLSLCIVETPLLKKVIKINKILTPIEKKFFIRTAGCAFLTTKE